MATVFIIHILLTDSVKLLNLVQKHDRRIYRLAMLLFKNHN